MNDKAAQNRADRVQTVFERGHDAEIVPRPADAPEQILVLCRAGGAQGPIRRHDVHRQQVVYGKAEFASEPALSAAERQPGNAGGRDGADRRRETEGLRLAIEVGPEHARLRADDTGDRVDADALHARQIDHQTAVAYRLAGDAVTAAFYRDEQIMLARELHRRDDVGRA